MSKNTRPNTYRLTPMNPNPRYKLRYRHHQWHTTLHIGSLIIPIGRPADSSWEAWRAIEGDIAYRAAALGTDFRDAAEIPGAHIDYSIITPTPTSPHHIDYDVDFPA